MGWIGRVELTRPIETLTRILTTPLILLAIPLYGLGFLLWLVVLSRLELSFAYPMFALSYIFTPLLAGLVLGEQVTWERWAGVFVICMGVALVGQSRR